MSETPVEEEVSLREERVSVERVPVNREATEADLRSAREDNLEFTERRVEAVVGKEARVVEEVVVGKEVENRKEVVRDKVRRTDVKVQPTTPNRSTDPNRPGAGR